MTSLLSAADMACMTSGLHLPDVCQIQRNTQAKKASGSTTDSWAVLATVACRVGQMGRQSPTEQLIADRVQVGTPWRVTLPAGTSVIAKDRIVFATHTLEVVGVLYPMSDEIVRVAVCKDIT